jgi:hypothetical protein
MLNSLRRITKFSAADTSEGGGGNAGVLEETDFSNWTASNAAIEEGSQNVKGSSIGDLLTG